MNVIHEIADERIHQQQDKGWTSEHDDTLTEGQLADAAVAYITGNKKLYPRGWMYKQSTKRRQLIKAAALIVAEIERLDRRTNDEQVSDSNHVRELAKRQDYPQDQEANEYRYISPAWLDAIAEGLTKGAVKHPGETWRQIPVDEHLARALRHINLYRMGDRSEPHIINASMRIMMAFETTAETTAETTTERTAERTTGADKTAGLKPCRCGTDSYPASTCGTIWSDLPAWRIFCPTCGATTGLNTGYGAAVIEWNRMQSERKNENYDGVRDGTGD